MDSRSLWLYYYPEIARGQTTFTGLRIFIIVGCVVSSGGCEPMSMAVAFGAFVVALAGVLAFVGYVNMTAPTRNFGGPSGVGGV